MRIAAIADLHGHLPPIPECDVLVIGGDVTPAHDHALEHQATWLDTTFRAWLASAPTDHVVGIAGNHDFVFERAPETVPTDLPWTYLNDEAATVSGLRFWGSPWTPWFFDWAFNAPKGDVEERFLRERYATVPADTDIFLTHGPPAGFGDHTSSGMDVGSRAALEVVRSVQPRLAIFGHIHEGRGRWTDGATTLANVAAVDLQYALVDEPFVLFDL
ncbi:metallophosphoesterase [Paraconexibacter sp.]|uniref:metallophosphoesterase family protein n=1 Tax=Paraconexibacter sp. TaxID=2949640 RepID=UPI003568A355